jgi:hypothetical protein
MGATTLEDLAVKMQQSERALADCKRTLADLIAMLDRMLRTMTEMVEELAAARAQYEADTIRAPAEGCIDEPTPRIRHQAQPER